MQTIPKTIVDAPGFRRRVLLIALAAEEEEERERRIRHRRHGGGRASATAAPPAASTLLDGLLAYYKLEEASGVRADETANNEDLTDVNTVTQAAGKLGQAASFDSLNLESLTLANTDFSLNGNMTFAAWIYPTGFAHASAGFGAGIASFHNNDAIGDWALTVLPGAGLKAFNWASAGNDLDGARATSDLILPLTTWVHVILRLDAGTQTIYVNGGSADLAAAGATSLGWGTDKFALGSMWQPGAQLYHFDGRIDSAGIWNRALTLAEIAELYNAGAGLEYPFS